jgi:hypothetical protein
MQSLENKEKIRMALQVHAASTVNDTGTDRKIDTPLAQSCSRDVLRRDLIVMREAHGANSAVGHRCSNLVELIQMPEIPTFQIERQTADLQRLLAVAVKHS